jgi:RHS repeat-associated protein
MICNLQVLWKHLLFRQPKRRPYQKRPTKKLDLEVLEWRFGPTPSIEMGLTAVGLGTIANAFLNPTPAPLGFAESEPRPSGSGHHDAPAAVVRVPLQEVAPTAPVRLAYGPELAYSASGASAGVNEDTIAPPFAFSAGRDFEQPTYNDLAALDQLLFDSGRPGPIILGESGGAAGGGSGSRAADNSAGAAPIHAGSSGGTAGFSDGYAGGFGQPAGTPASFGPPLPPAQASGSAAAPGKTPPGAPFASSSTTLVPPGPSGNPHSPVTAGPAITGGGMTLYIMDMNNGLILSPNVSVNDFSGYSVSLDADVGGDTVSSYSWNTSNASDATNVSGSSTYRLTFTWASFTSGTHTDTISFTATGSSHNTVTGTITFLVAGTGSPAYSSTPPTTSSTWLNVQPPDAVSDQQAMGGAGPYYQIGLTDGEMQTSHSFPAYNPNVPALGLVYVSTAANAKEIFAAHYQLPPGVSVPGQLTGSLTFNGNPVSSATFYVGGSGLNPPNLNAGDSTQLALLADASSLSTGRYSYSFQVVDTNANPQTTTYSGSADVLNYKSNAFGAGWNLTGLERIYSVSGGVILDLGDGQSLWFANGSTAGSFVTPPGDFSTLTQNTTSLVYTRTMPDGTQINFNSSGYQTSVVDRNGNTNSYNWNASNRLTSIQDFNHQLETFAYSGSGNATTVTDPANRVATLSYDGSGRLASIQDPDGSLWSYSYNGSNDLTQLTDPLAHSSTFAYQHARVYSATRPDGTTESFSPVQTQGLAASVGDSPQTTNAVMLGQAAANYTDPRNNIWSTYLDWLGFGQPTEYIDPLNDTSIIHRDPNGLAWMPADPLAHRSRDFFDSKGNVTKHVQPDDNSWQYTYNSYSEPLQTTDPRGNLSTASYDSKGNETQLKDASGNLTSYTYSGQGFMTTMKDPLGHTTSYGLDSLNRTTTATDALGNLSTSLFDSASNLTGSIDARGDRSTYSFDALGRQTQVQDAVGNLSTTLYDSAGNATVAIDGRGDRTTYSFDKLNRQTQVQDALGNLSTTLYDANGNATTVIDARGNRTTYSFDAANRITQVKDALGDLTTTLYDQAGNVTGTIDARGDRTTFSFDGLNRQTQVQDALGDLSTTVFDQAGNATVTIDPLGHRTSYSFDSLNRQTQVQDAAGDLSTTIFDAAGNVTATIDGRGDRTTLSYDALNRQTQVQDAAGNLSTTLYDKAGNATGTIDGRGDRTTYSFDADNRQTAVTDALNHTVTTIFDQAGNVAQTIDASGFIYTYSCDKLNRQTTVQDPGGGLSTTVYDKAGNVTNTIDQMGDKTTYVFDALNRQTQVIDARGYSTTTVLDAVGNTVNIIDADGNKTTFIFDALNRETQMTDPLGHSSTMAYDAASRLTSATDRDGRVISYSYDAINRKIGETWTVSGSTVNTFTFSYDGASNLLGAANSAGVYTMNYDTLNRMTAVQEPFGLSLTYAYDQASNRTLVQDSLNGVLTSVYNAANLLTTREFGGAGQTPLRIDLAYTPRNQLSTINRWSDLAGTQAVGSSSYAYDGLGRVTNIQHANASGSNLANYTYMYDLASRLTQEQDNGTSITYGYDATSQLTSAGGTNCSYDATGNRTMTGYQTGAGNELVSDNTWSYVYDNEGNLTKKTKGASAETWYFAYDNRNHLTSAKQEQTDGGTLLMQATYLYDALGNRVEKDVWTSTGGLTVSRLGYDGQNVWVDLNGSNQLQMRRLYLDAVDSVFARVDSGGNAAWYLTDQLGSVRVVINSSDTNTDIVTYDAFGNVTAESNSTFGDRYKWTGREFDAESGFQYNRARCYASPVGRWTSQDPIGFSGSDVNLYRYVHNFATSFTDPTGLAQKKEKVATYNLSIADTEPSAGTWGAFAWAINWVLKGNPDKDGLIVQHLTIGYDLKFADGRKGNFVHQLLKSFVTDYYEFWQFEAKTGEITPKGPYPGEIVERGFRITPDGVSVVKGNYNDWFWLPEVGRDADGELRPPYTENGMGTISFRGKATFFEGVSFDDLKKHGYDVKEGGAAGSGSLQSIPTSQAPGLYDFLEMQSNLKFSNTVNHLLTIEIDAKGKTTFPAMVISPTAFAW